MDIVTYSLSKEEQRNSNKYYYETAAFTDEVLKKSEDLIDPIIRSYHLYLSNIGEENNASEETLLEFLILGVLMRLYYFRALELSKTKYRLMNSVNNVRKNNRTLKPTLNLLKGIMSSLFLFNDLSYINGPRTFNMKQLNKLILWLEASGEFSKEVERLRKWEGYLGTLSAEESTAILKISYNFAKWFETRSNEVLGKYTLNVDKYIKDIKPSEFWREDIILRKRAKVESHLNMIGADLMNRAFRKDFVAKNKKVLLLPLCMTSPSKVSCQSEGFGRDFKCKGCSSKCQVNQLTVLGQKSGFSVMVIPHESSISAYNNKETLFGENTGVIGVACVLNLISGGWLLKDMNIPAQCVLLDYCGCKNHWHSKGISTQINIERLKEILR